MSVRGPELLDQANERNECIVEQEVNHHAPSQGLPERAGGANGELAGRWQAQFCWCILTNGQTMHGAFPSLRRAS